MPNIGDTAPDFSLLNQDGETINLHDCRGKKVILFAFPKADTPGCTIQACGFRDNFPKIEGSNAVVLGISPDTPDDLRAWKDKEKFTYDLLSDVDHSVLETWEAWGDMTYKERTFTGTLRSFWVMDEDGKVIAAQVRVTPEDSVRMALEAVEG